MCIGNCESTFYVSLTGDLARRSAWGTLGTEGVSQHGIKLREEKEEDDAA